jgi:hypothetical protein
MCLIFDFSNKFSFYNNVWIRLRIRIFFRIRIQPKLLDSFGFGSTILGTISKKGCSARLFEMIFLQIQYTVQYKR